VRIGFQNLFAAAHVNKPFTLSRRFGEPATNANPEVAMPFPAEVTLGLKIEGGASPLLQSYKFGAELPLPGSVEIPAAQGAHKPGRGRVYLGGVPKDRLTCLLIIATASDGKSAYERECENSKTQLLWDLELATSGTSKSDEYNGDKPTWPPMLFPRLYDRATKAS
jgi:hypothetical protein